MTFVIYKDYMTGEHHLGYTYETIEAKNDIEAVAKADEMWKEEANKLYLIRIMKKDGKVIKEENGWKRQNFKAVLCKRSEEGGWHLNNSQNCESQHIAGRFYKKDIEYFKAM